jgi:molecular chaperone GrpE
VEINDRRAARNRAGAEAQQEAAGPGGSEIRSEPAADQVRMHETSEVERTALDELYADDDASAAEPQPEPEVRVIEVNKDYLDDLKRLQAEFDNYRKRMMKEQSRASAAGARGLVEKLLPVLDNFDLAIAHGEGGSGVALVHKELMEALRVAGLDEVPAEGHPFDPAIHEAVESRDEGAEGHVVTQVYRRGYRFGDQLLRPAMVVVASAGESPEA